MNQISKSTNIVGIDIKGAFWLRVNSKVASFGTAEMKGDVHFSIGYNPDLDELNFHVTRNIQGGKQEKPKTEICRINRLELEAMLPSLGKMAWYKILELLRVQKIRRRGKHCYRGLGFYPFGESPDPTISNFSDELKMQFTMHAKIKKKMLKIPASLEPHLENLMMKTGLQESISQKIRWLPHPHKSSAQAGFVISKKFTGCVILSGGKWWAIRNDINFSHFLDGWAGKALSKSLQFKALRAYARVRQLENYQQAEKYNNPIRLYHINNDKSIQ